MEQGRDRNETEQRVSMKNGARSEESCIVMPDSLLTCITPWILVELFDFHQGKWDTRVNACR